MLTLQRMFGKISAVRVHKDVHTYKELANQYGVHSVPAILLFKNGQLVDQIDDVLPRADIAEKLDDLLVDGEYISRKVQDESSK